MAVLETYAVITGWIYIALTLFLGIPIAWYWAATGHTERPWTPSIAAIRTALSLWYSSAFLILLVLR